MRILQQYLPRTAVPWPRFKIARTLSIFLAIGLLPYLTTNFRFTTKVNSTQQPKGDRIISTTISYDDTSFQNRSEVRASLIQVTTKTPAVDYAAGLRRYLAKGLYPIPSLVNSSEAQRAFREKLIGDVYFFEQRPSVVIGSVCIASAGLGDEVSSFAEITRRRTADYAALHNYTFVYVNQWMDDADAFHPSWQKMLLLKRLMESNIAEAAKHDFVMIIDADAYITNMSVWVENFFTQVVDRQIDFVVTSDISHEAEWFFNGGVLMLRNTPLMRSFVDDVLKGHDEYPQYQWNVYWEQSVILLKFYSNDELQRRTLVLPHCLQQSFDCSWQPGDFILHTAGLRGPGQRSTIMKFLSETPSSNWTHIPHPREIRPHVCSRP